VRVTKQKHALERNAMRLHDATRTEMPLITVWL
jgi:hypothetical protein